MVKAVGRVPFSLKEDEHLKAHFWCNVRLEEVPVEEGFYRYRVNRGLTQRTTIDVYMGVRYEVLGHFQDFLPS